MILRPLSPKPASCAAAQAAWPVVSETQQRPSPEHWLITQPDHAALAGSMAAAMGPPLLPQLGDEIVRGIAVHDDGWAELDARMPAAGDKPLSFLDILPPVFLPVWTASVEKAQEVAAMAGAIVSGHFSRLAEHRLLCCTNDTGEDRLSLAEFRAREEARQQRLVGSSHQAEFESLTDVLQFCDLLSLYLCCGAEADVEFPQEFHGRRISLRRQPRLEDSPWPLVCRLEPSPFRKPVQVEVKARKIPGAETASFGFALL